MGIKVSKGGKKMEDIGLTVIQAAEEIGVTPHSINRNPRKPKR